MTFLIECLSVCENWHPGYCSHKQGNYNHSEFLEYWNNQKKCLEDLTTFSMSTWWGDSKNMEEIEFSCWLCENWYPGYCFHTQGSHDHSAKTGLNSFCISQKWTWTVCYQRREIFFPKPVWFWLRYMPC